MDGRAARIPCVSRQGHWADETTDEQIKEALHERESPESRAEHGRPVVRWGGEASRLTVSFATTSAFGVVEFALVPRTSCG